MKIQTTPSGVALSKMNESIQTRWLHILHIFIALLPRCKQFHKNAAKVSLELLKAAFFTHICIYLHKTIKSKIEK